MSSINTEQQEAVEQSSTENGIDRRTLFVRSIPLDATSEELSEFFSQFAPVKHAVIVTDSNHESRGFGFVSFALDDDALTALVESKKAKFKGRVLKIDVAKRRERKDKDRSTETEKKPVKAPSVEKRRARLIIRNLPWSCKNAEELKPLFSKYGAVFDAYIPRKKGGRMCGFAFVVMKKQSAAEKAVKESVGLKIHGREVAVDFAVEKSKWEEIKETEAENDESESEDEEDANEKQEKETSSDDGSEDDASNMSDASEDSSDDSDSDSDAESGSESEDIDIENDNGSESEGDEESQKAAEKENLDKPKKNKQDPFTVFVRNLPYDATKETLKEHFSRFGPVKYALPVIEKSTNLAKGTAFVSFYKEESYISCIENAPSTSANSLLISDDVSSDYVFQGRVLSVTPSVDRESAHKLAERNLSKRKEITGKAPGEKDKRNLFLLNEGRITENSKLASFIAKSDMELREKSYQLRVQQLKKNPTLHLSLTRLAIRNLPRAMNSKSLKALGRKAVVSFASEVKEEKRHALSKEEIDRSTKHKKEAEELQVSKKKSKNAGVVRQAKVIKEVKGAGEAGRSRGYGFIEYRDHKSALMGLRWLNAHEVSVEEIMEGMSEEEKAVADLDGNKKRRLIVEFAIENAKVIKRRKERVIVSRMNNKRKNEEADDEADGKDAPPAKRQKHASSSSKKPFKKGSKDNKDNKSSKGNKGNKGSKSSKSSDNSKKDHTSSKAGKGDSLPDNIKKLIGFKRKRKMNKK
ncbi:Piso0_003765 [Millerozyma farinosa CBS 7064]|uniref:Piso0_003765 protein n=1 Tax=Pichia sorbitophila (strain ATCC MYA-4447 / BCRC 22081 / CBS 7064 / NBRC 10061 / NRRL Y-12695) TaxID=559304 RepID=G8Y6J4_PICSO|nr:Piso0_003765 [Millerozyma farinosa CBS 7064]CCE84224.1 Piso0_003765 [Millerozyma farinosa CBS 7064]